MEAIKSLIKGPPEAMKESRGVEKGDEELRLEVISLLEVLPGIKCLTHCATILTHVICTHKCHLDANNIT